MKIKSLVLTVLLCSFLMVPAVGFGFGGYNPPAPDCGTNCEVSNPYQATVGVDLKLDFDVCFDTPQELCKYQGCEQSVIVQDGKHNFAKIDQTGTNFALIYQKGDWNYGNTVQTGSGNTALTLQMGSFNVADINQSANGASAVISQWGCGNMGSIVQK